MPRPSLGDVGPYGGRQAAALEPHRGKWVAVRGLEVLVSAEAPEEVLAWLEKYDEQAEAMFRVPTDPRGAEGAAPA